MDCTYPLFYCRVIISWWNAGGKSSRYSRTRARRPDLAEKIELPHKTRAEKKFLQELESEWEEYQYEYIHQDAEDLD